MSFYSPGTLSQAIGHIKSIDDQNASRNYQEKTEQINRDSQTTSLLNNTIGAGLGTFGGGLTAVRQTVKRVKQLKNKLFIRRKVSDLMKPLDENERTGQNLLREDYFNPGSRQEGVSEGDLLEQVRNTLGGETKEEEPQTFSRDIFSELEEEQRQAELGPQRATRTSDLFSQSEGDIPILETQHDRDMRIAQVKSNFREHLSELDEPQQQRFINEELQDDKPDFYSQTFKQSVQRAPKIEQPQEIEMSNLQPKTSTSVQEAQSRDVVSSNEPMFYRQTEEGVSTQPIQEGTEMESIPPHAYTRSNFEILESGFNKPRISVMDLGGGETSTWRFARESTNEQYDWTLQHNAPQATSEMKPVIGSSGKQVGVSSKGADLSEGVEDLTEGGNITESAATQATTEASEGISTGLSTAIDVGIDSTAATIDAGLNVLDAIPLIGEISAAASLIGGIGLTIGSSIVSGEKSSQEQQTAETQYNQQLNQGSNYAGRYTSNVFTSQHMFN